MKEKNLAERQAEADENMAPRSKENVVWRGGVGLPKSFVKSLPQPLLPPEDDNTL